MQEWRVCSKKADFKALEQKFGIDQVLARIIRNRDIISDEEFDRYLNGTMADLYDPFRMKDMQSAVKIMSDSIARGDKIRIIGDYDIDGISSIYILFIGLKKLGALVDYDIPDRISDGYGINERLIDEAFNDGINLIITCDNGIAATNQIAHAKELGMTVIVTDHHDVPFVETNGTKEYILPPADAVVNPKQADCDYPFKVLCGAGIAYKFIEAMYGGEISDADLCDELIVFAAIATVGDIVDLIDENRIIVKKGLELIGQTKNIGLKALIQETGLNDAKISAYHIGFVIGPCMNASGRLDTAKRALSMFLAGDELEAKQIACELRELNDERKRLTKIFADEAIHQVMTTTLSDDRVLVVYLPDCHESIAGIVAGKVRERFYKPAIVLTDASEGVKGSARSIEGYNMFEELTACKEYLTKFGGHPMAAGLSLTRENIEPLRNALNKNCTLTETDLTEKVWIDVPVPLEYLNEKLIADIELLEPFGKANSKPVFADKNLIITAAKTMGKEGQFVALDLSKNNGIRMKAVGFFRGEELLDAYKLNKRVSCTYYPEINSFRGEKKLQICITGYKIEEV